MKAVVLGRSRAGWRLVGAAEAPIPETGSSDPDIVAGAIREVLDTLRVRRAQVVAGLSGQSAIVKRLSLPRMSDTELADALPWEAEQYVPFDLADVHLTYDRLPEAADQPTTELLLVAAKNERIDARTDLILQAGARPVVMDLEAFALANAYVENCDAPPTGVTLLVHCGKSSTVVCLLEGAVLAVTRDIALGGQTYTEALRRDLDVAPAVAERLKQASHSIVPGVDPEQVLAILSEVTSQIVVEIRKSVDFYRAARPVEAINRIVVSGGACRAEGLQALLTHEFEAPVEIADPFRRIARTGRRTPLTDGTGPAFAVAVGLAMRQDGAR